MRSTKCQKYQTRLTRNDCDSKECSIKSGVTCVNNTQWGQPQATQISKNT